MAGNNVVLVVCCIDFRFEGDEVDAALSKIYGVDKKSLDFKLFVLPGAAIGLHPCNHDANPQPEDARKEPADERERKHRLPGCCALTELDHHYVDFGARFDKSLGSFGVWKDAFVHAVGQYGTRLKEVLFLNHQDCGVFKTVNHSEHGDKKEERLAEYDLHVSLVKDTVKYVSTHLGLPFAGTFRAYLLNLSGEAKHVYRLYPELPVEVNETGDKKPTGEDLQKTHEHEELHTAECIVVTSMDSFGSGGSFDDAMQDLGIGDQYDLVTLPDNVLGAPTGSSQSSNPHEPFLAYAIELLILCARLHGPRRLLLVLKLGDFWDMALNAKIEAIKGYQNVIKAFLSNVQQRLWTVVT